MYTVTMRLLRRNLAMYQLSWFVTPENDLNDEKFAFNSTGYPPPEGAFVWYGDYREKGAVRNRYRVIRVEWSITLLANEPARPYCNVVMTECPYQK